MEWWQTALVSVVITSGVVYFGAWLNRRAVKDERKYKEEAELWNAVECLLAEMNDNLKLTEEPLSGGVLPPFARDMWDTHKGNVVRLPLELQESLRHAYFLIGNVNAVVQTELAVASTKGITYFDNRYRNEVNKTKELLREARDKLTEWLEQRRTK